MHQHADTYHALYAVNAKANERPHKLLMNGLCNICCVLFIMLVLCRPVTLFALVTGCVRFYVFDCKHTFTSKRRKSLGKYANRMDLTNYLDDEKIKTFKKVHELLYLLLDVQEFINIIMLFDCGYLNYFFLR